MDGLVGVGPRLRANGEEAAEEGGGTKVAVACAGSFAVTLAPAPAESPEQAKKAEKKNNPRMQSELNADENALAEMKCVPPSVSFVLLRSRACMW